MAVPTDHLEWGTVSLSIWCAEPLPAQPAVFTTDKINDAVEELDHIASVDVRSALTPIRLDSTRDPLGLGRPPL